jgi:primase-polymerase (primpol)-like protein
MGPVVARGAGRQWTKLIRPASTPTGGEDERAATWAPFAKVRPAVASGACSGLGFVFSADDPLFFLDLDHCRDPDTGEIAPWALDYLEGFYGTYIEVSPSGTGIKVIGEGTLPASSTPSRSATTAPRSRCSTGSSIRRSPDTVWTMPPST